MDTATGIGLLELQERIQRGIPRLFTCSHPDFAFHNTDYQSSSIIASGSRYDGSAVLQDILGHYADEDTMLCRCSYLPEETAERIIKYIDDHSVYCKLDVTDEPSLRENFPTVKRSGRYYLSASQFRQHLHQDSSEKDMFPDLFKHSVIKEEDIPGRASRVVYNKNQVTKDVVHCIPCFGWPTRAVQLQLESIGSSRLSTITPQISIFHVVPKCRPGGDVDVEWRLSFSLMEQVLMQTTWSQEQRALYSLVKCLNKTYIKLPEFITTYHIKTCIFWCHNEIKMSSNLGQCLLGILDFLLYTLIQGFMPLYFVPEFNLFEYVPEDFLNEASQRISNLRSKIPCLPDHLGIYDRPMTRRLEEGEKLQLMTTYVVNNCTKGIDTFQFSELGDLHSCIHTLMYMWESYLYMAIELIGETDEKWIRHSMITDIDILSVWKTFITAAAINGYLLGYDKQKVSHDEVSSRLGEKPNEARVYFKTYDGVSFQVCARSLQPEDERNETIHCFTPVTGTYYDETTQLLVGETPEAMQNLYDLINMLPAQALDLLSLKNLTAEKSVLYDTMVGRHAFVGIHRALGSGHLAELRDLYADPHTLFYMWESFIYKAVEELCPNDELMVHQCLTARISKIRLLDLWRQLPGVAKKHRHLFGFTETDDIYVIPVKQMTRYLMDGGLVYQIVYDGVKYELQSRNFDETDKYDDSIVEIFSQDKTYFDMKTKLLCKSGTIERIRRIIDRLPGQELQMITLF